MGPAAGDVFCVEISYCTESRSRGVIANLKVLAEALKETIGVLCTLIVFVDVLGRRLSAIGNVEPMRRRGVLETC